MESNIKVDEQKLENDLSYRMEHLKDFIGYTKEDETILNNTLPLLAPHAESFVDGIYDHLFRFSSTAKFFIDESGMIRDVFLKKRKETLTGWLGWVGKGKTDIDFTQYIVKMGHAHSKQGGELRMDVPRHYMLTLMSVAQSNLTVLLNKVIKDKDEYVKAVSAWNKMMMLVLEFMLFGKENKPE